MAFLFLEREVIMDKKQNIDTPNGFSKKIGRTHFLVNFAFKKDATESIKDKTKKLIRAEATGKKS
ncbi:MAG: hypothetical protein MJZ11_08885 [Lachnospiraceae bacterium]|nr:hypothetical protein [Lachnospiraceae bacterium]